MEEAEGEQQSPWRQGVPPGDKGARREPRGAARWRADASERAGPWRASATLPPSALDDL